MKPALKGASVYRGSETALTLALSPVERERVGHVRTMREQRLEGAKASSVFPLPGAYQLRTSLGSNSVNPNGIPAQSPGLRGTSYPGKARPHAANPNGVVAVRRTEGRNPVGVGTLGA